MNEPENAAAAMKPAAAPDNIAGDSTRSAPPLALVVTLGCKVNQFESSAMMESLRGAGYEAAESGFGAALVVLNTCTVTHKADHEALALLRRLRRQNPAARIVATGCLAQASPEFLAESGLVDLVLGQDEKSGLAETLNGCLAGPGPEGLVRVAPVAPGPARDFGAPAPERTRAFYKIQDGCSAFCAYCAVPLARGPSRSLPLDTVLGGLREYMGRGLAELALCGIHLGLWGRDLRPAASLAELLHAIDAELAPDEELFRLRLSSIEPQEFGPELFECLEMYPWLARHLHLPLQSGSDKVLGLMGRPYRAAEFAALAARLKAAWPAMALGVDVMVGFPGESEADFEATRKLLEELPVSYFHIFPYSKRSGTRAAESPDQVPEADKKRRAAELKILGRQKRRDFALANLGRKELGLVENTPHKSSGRWKVLTGNYLSALLPPGLAVEGGALVPVTLAGPANPWGLLEALP